MFNDVKKGVIAAVGWNIVEVGERKGMEAAKLPLEIL
jgi:hypothetical protein